jgi:hypothetical protein
VEVYGENWEGYTHLVTYDVYKPKQLKGTILVLRMIW